MRRAAQSLIRCLGRVISLLHLTAITFLAFEFHQRLKIVRIEAQVTVETIDQRQLLCAQQALIADVAPHHGVVILLYKTVVVLAIGARSRKSDPFMLTILEQVVVDELRAIIRIDALQSKRHLRAQLLERGKDPHLGFVLDRLHFRPATVNIGHIKRVKILAGRQPAVMGHQVDLHKAGPLLVPFTESSQRNLLLQERPRLSSRGSAQLMFAPLGSQQPIDGRRTDLQQLLSGATITLELPEVLQALHHLRHDRYQSLPTNEIQNPPDAPQPLQPFLIVMLTARRPPPPTDRWPRRPASLPPTVA